MSPQRIARSRVACGIAAALPHAPAAAPLAQAPSAVGGVMDAELEEIIVRARSIETTTNVTGFEDQPYGGYYVANLGARLYLDAERDHRLNLRLENALGP